MSEILKVYVDGHLRRTLISTNEMYMLWLRKGTELDLILERDRYGEEYTIQNTGYVRICLTKEGKIYVVTT